MEADTAPRRALAVPPGGRRDRFLDTLRTVALLRVTLWHAFGAPVLTYLVAAVPAMFFVTGSLLAKSLDRRPWPSVLADRARRVLLPLWVFGAGAFVAMRIAWLADPSPRTAVPWRSIVFWIVPLGNPKGSAWEGGWMSQPLWYVRAMFWLLLLSPLLRAGLRRARIWAFVPPLVLMFALDALGRNPRFTIRGAPELVWQFGDLALYSVFLMAGFAHRDGHFDRLSPAEWFGGSIVAAAAGAAWIVTQPVPLGVVNNSHPAHLFVGAAWLCALFACRLPISRFAERRIPRTVVDWVSQRTMTIYLWHSTAIILTYHVLARHQGYPAGAYAVLMIVGMVCITLSCVLAFGWVEDIAARRTPRVCPLLVTRGDTRAERVRFVSHRRAVYRVVGAPAVAGVLLVALSAQVARPSEGELVAGAAGSVSAAAARSAKRPPVPSQAPPRPEFQPVATDGPTATTTTPRTAIVSPVAADTQPAPLAPVADRALADVLQRTLDEWRVRWAVPGVMVGVVLPGVAEWHGGSGADQVSGLAVHADDRFDIGSVTKTFTGTIVFQFAAEGKIAIDAPLPRLTRVPDFPYSAGITVRQLLTHRTGLVPYRDTRTFAADPDAIDTPDKALAAALREPLQFVPGAKSAYSSTNYIVLGFLVEQVTGQTFDALLDARAVKPTSLRNITHSAPTAQAPNFSTSGIVTDTAALLRWAVSLYRDHIVIDAGALAAMHDIDVETGLGPAVYGFCPCTVDGSGVIHWRWIGHSGGTTEIAFSDDDDLAIALNVTDSLWLPERGRAIAELLEIMRTAALQATVPATLKGFTEDSAPKSASPPA